MIRLKNLREDIDLRQKDLADYLNIHQSTYSDYELGNLNIPVSIWRWQNDLQFKKLA